MLQIAPVTDEEKLARDTLEQAGEALAAMRPDVPANFAAQLYARTVPEDILHCGAEDLARLAARAWDFLAERDAGKPKIRCETVALTESADRKSISVVEIVNDDMPFLVDSVMGELAERRLPVRLVAHPVFGVERDGRQAASRSAGPTTADGARELHPYSYRADRRQRKPCAELVAALGKVLGEVRLAVHDWRPMRARVRRHRCRAEGQSAAAAGRRDRGSDPVPAMAARRQFHLPRRARLRVRRHRRWSRTSTSAPRHPARARLARAQARQRALEFTPEIMAFLKEPRPLIVAKANIHARVHRRVYLDYIGVKRFDADGNLDRRAPHRRPVHLDRLYPLGAQHSLSAPQDRRGRAARRLRSEQPFRQGAGQCAGDTIRATNCSRSTTTRSISFAMAILQLDERPRVRVLARRDRFDRFVSVLVFVPRERYDSDIRAKIGDYLARRLQRPRLGLLPVLPGRAAGARALHHRPLRRRDAGFDRATLEARRRGDRAHLDRRLERGARAASIRRSSARELFTRYRDAFSAGYPATPMRRRSRPATSASSKACPPQRPLGVDFHHRLEEEQRVASA